MYDLFSEATDGGTVGVGGEDRSSVVLALGAHERRGQLFRPGICAVDAGQFGNGAVRAANYVVDVHFTAAGCSVNRRNGPPKPGR